jgi:hypothetical protein
VHAVLALDVCRRGQRPRDDRLAPFRQLCCSLAIRVSSAARRTSASGKPSGVSWGSQVHGASPKGERITPAETRHFSSELFVAFLVLLLLPGCLVIKLNTPTRSSSLSHLSSVSRMVLWPYFLQWVSCPKSASNGFSLCLY